MKLHSSRKVPRSKHQVIVVALNILDDYKAYYHNFIKILEPFKSTWDGYFGHVTITINRVEMDTLTTRQMHCVL